VEPGLIDQYALEGGLDMVPAILDGDVCVKLLRGADWVATAQIV
jgi:hypothetical protein